MEYKVIERPPTPPDTPNSSIHLDEVPAGGGNLYEEARGSSLKGIEIGLGAGTSTYRPPSPTLHISHHDDPFPRPESLPNSTQEPWNSNTQFDHQEESSNGSRRGSHAARRPPPGLSVDPSRPLPLPKRTTSPAYPLAGSNMMDQIQYNTRQIVQSLRLSLGLASQTVINVLPSSPTTANGSAGPRISPARAPSPSALANGSNTSSRLLTGGANGKSTRSKDKNRAESNDEPNPAWRRAFELIRGLFPASGSGPKRIRTRTRRLLIFIAALTLVCYIFSNTLREAYYSAALERRHYNLDELLQEENLGKHLSEYKRHPIEDLMAKAKRSWEDKVSRQSQTVDEAIKEYKRRYRRDPPVGFAEWFDYAKGEEPDLLEYYAPDTPADTLIFNLSIWFGTCGRIRLTHGFARALLGDGRS